jgi:hypothetical protein
MKSRLSRTGRSTIRRLLSENHGIVGAVILTHSTATVNPVNALKSSNIWKRATPALRRSSGSKPFERADERTIRVRFSLLHSFEEELDKSLLAVRSSPEDAPTGIGDAIAVQSS